MLLLFYCHPLLERASDALGRVALPPGTIPSLTAACVAFKAIHAHAQRTDDYVLPAAMNAVLACFSADTTMSRPSLPLCYSAPDALSASALLDNSSFVWPRSPSPPPSPSPPKRPSLDALQAIGYVSNLCQAESILELIRTAATQMRTGTQALIQAIHR